MSQDLNEVFPLEIWTNIFPYIEEISSIKSVSLVCRYFTKNICSAITYIKSSKRYISLYERIEKFVNLKGCDIVINHPSIDEIKHLFKFRTFSIKTSYIFFKEWIRYWMLPERTQEEFNSISHTFNVYFNYDNNYNSVQKFEIKNGILNSVFSKYFIRDIFTITQKYNIIIEANVVQKLTPIFRDFYPNMMGLKLIDWIYDFNIFKFIADTANLNYVKINPAIGQYYAGPNTMKTLLNSIQNLCDREVSIDIPIHLECLDKLLTKFPNIKFVRILSPTNEPLPEIQGVIVTCFDNSLIKYSY